VGIGTTNPGTNLEVAAGNVQGVRITSINSPSLQLYSTAGGSHNWQVNSNYNVIGDFTLYDATAAVTRLEITSSGNVSIGNTTATSMFNVGTANQFQVSSTGVSSAGAGSTDLNGSGVPEAHCLADGTGGCITLGGALSCSNVTFYSGAGTSPTCNSLTGYDSTFTLTMTTGSTPAATATIFEVNFTASRGHNTSCVALPIFSQYSSILQIPGNTSPNNILGALNSGSVPLNGSSTYIYNMVCP
jgi:hypothetical protein